MHPTSREHIVPSRHLTAIFLSLLIAACPAMLSAQTRITLDPAERHQTFRAWEATATVKWSADLDPFFDTIMDRLITDFGITRMRVGVFAGAENTSHAFARMRDGQITLGDYNPQRYLTVNDDADPFHINAAGFDFADLDWRIEKQFLPLKARADAAGVPFGFTLNYVAFTDDQPEADYFQVRPDEYAEFILAAFLHLRDRWGLVPDALEVVLEPDRVKEWTPDRLGRAMAAVGPRLAAAGFTPRLIAPSVTNAAHLVPWMDGIAAVPGATQHMTELSYHRYFGGTPDVLAGIAARGAAMGLPTGMLEFFNGKGGYAVIHSDLKIADAAVWQGRATMGYFLTDNGALTVPDDVRMNRQYTHYIRPGMTRIGAASADEDAFDPLAFVSPDGQATVVIMADDAGSVEVTGLAQGDYFLSAATAQGTVDNLDPVHVADGVPLTAAITGPGVITISTIRP
jgi:O-glycosyl hydrolase